MTLFFKWLLGSNRCNFAAASTTAIQRIVWLTLLFLGWASTAQAAIPASERQVLLDLYASTNGASWITKTNWNGGVGTECNWYGVGCDYTQSHVTSITLISNNLFGTLPSLSSLTDLQGFDVGYNRLAGFIPSLSGLTALRVFGARDNQLTGPIPPSAG